MAPVSTLSPVISGTSTVGSVLTVSAGSWSGVPAPTLTYQWLRDAGVIAGQTAMTYTVVSGDVTKTITCRVTATNSAGSASANSNALVPESPVLSVPSGFGAVPFDVQIRTDGTTDFDPTDYRLVEGGPGVTKRPKTQARMSNCRRLSASITACRNTCGYLTARRPT